MVTRQPIHGNQGVSFLPSSAMEPRIIRATRLATVTGFDNSSLKTLVGHFIAYGPQIGL